MNIIGLQQVLSQLAHKRSQGFGGSFILLEGPDASGKRLIVQKLALDWAGCAPIMLEPDSTHTGYSLEQIKGLSRQIYQTGLARQFLGFILTDLDLLAPISANALLKTLEELPAHVAIFSTARSDRPVLQTIRSRALKLRAYPQPFETIKNWALSNQYTIDDEALFAEYSQGCVGKAWLYMQVSTQARLDLARQFANANEYSEFFALITSYDDLEKQETISPITLLEELLCVVANKWQVGRFSWLEYRCWLEASQRARVSIERNTKFSQAIEALWLELKDLKRL